MTKLRPERRDFQFANTVPNLLQMPVEEGQVARGKLLGLDRLIVNGELSRFELFRSWPVVELAHELFYCATGVFLHRPNQCLKCHYEIDAAPEEGRSITVTSAVECELIDDVECLFLRGDAVVEPFVCRRNVVDSPGVALNVFYTLNVLMKQVKRFYLLLKIRCKRNYGGSGRSGALTSSFRELIRNLQGSKHGGDDSDKASYKSAQYRSREADPGLLGLRECKHRRASKCCTDQSCGYISNKCLRSHFANWPGPQAVVERGWALSLFAGVALL